MKCIYSGWKTLFAAPAKGLGSEKAMKKIKFAGGCWQEQVQHLRLYMNKSKRKINYECRRKIKNEAQWIFDNWAQENIPAVPHHLIGAKNKNYISNEKNAPQ